jgi:hypothetical protein
MNDDYGLTCVSNGGWILVDHDNGDVAAFTCMADLAEYFEAIEGAPIGVAQEPLWGDAPSAQPSRDCDVDEPAPKEGKITATYEEIGQWFAMVQRDMFADKKKG